MTDSLVIFLGSMLPILVIGIVWVLARLYSVRLSRIDEELHVITMMLSKLPKESSLQEYMFSQDQRLRSIGEKLDSHPDPASLQQYIQEHTQLLNLIISLLGEKGKTVLNKADIENSLRVTNNSLEKVLWTLRFDEGKYSESTSAVENKFAESGKAKGKSINKASEASDDTKSMKTILKNNDDNYDAMLKYMNETGKDGSNALHALANAGGLHSG